MNTRLYSAVYAARVIAYLYIILLCFFWFMDNYGANYFNWPMALLIISGCYALFIRKTFFDKSLGIIVAIGSCYMLLAVLNAYGRAMDKAHHDVAINILRYGSLVFSLSFLSGFILVLLAYFAPHKGGRL